jgi:1-deoxy-D-xylulose-5-phosphate reductoisomerase
LVPLPLPWARRGVNATKTVSIAGSTGSIGTQALDVVRSSGGRFEITALGARSSVHLLAEQAHEVHPARVAIADAAKAGELAGLLPTGTELLAGEGALAAIAEDADIVLNGVVGFAGLPVTLAALRAGRRLALANKESLIAGGPVVQRALETPGAEIVPVDSEHCAVHQCLQRLQRHEKGESGTPALRRILLTASGGPFRGKSLHELSEVTVEDALAHPTWRMGPMNTLNSSTLMNKGLEVIEAHLLFGASYDQIEVVVHPQSIVHSMVETSDGATLAQLSMPDMRLPIGYAFSYPDRMATAFGAIDWSKIGRLDFEIPDPATFPCLTLAYEAGRQGGTAPAGLNGANEVAVEGFLAGQLRWVDIPVVIEETMAHFEPSEPRDVDDVLGADAEARALALEALSACRERQPLVSRREVAGA